jgi:hypothetical protein
MEVADKISAIIFGLVLISIVIYVVMGAYVVGPASDLKKGERIILAVGAMGILGILLYAGAELLFQIVF